jgi:hypothetical protein
MLQSFAFRSPLLGRLSRRPAWNRQARDLTGLSPSGLRLQLVDCRLCLRILVWRLLIFRLRKRPKVLAEGQHASVPIQSLLMQINADAASLVRTQFQQLICISHVVQHGYTPLTKRAQ